MTKRKFIIVGFVITAFAAIVWLIAYPKAPPPMAMAVSFVGYTNDATTGRLARFAVTNSGASAIRRWGFCLPQSQPQSNGRYSMHKFGADINLTPGQSEIISLSPPTNQGAWRVTFYYSRDGGQLRLTEWFDQGSGKPVNALLPAQLRKGLFQYVESDWIDNEAAAPP